MTEQIEFPEHYRGIYQRVETQYRPLIREALETIRNGRHVPDLAPYLAFQTWENPQPSFILLPLMYLATAEAAGGITDRHRDYLPTIMLMAEFCAVADDTIDRTLQRSGRPTFASRFGDASAVPMSFALSSMVLSNSRHHPLLFENAERFLMEFAGLELWERSHVYPEMTLLRSWLRRRYLQATIATGYALNAGLILHRRDCWPSDSVAGFAQIGQDVDDIVNIVEYREADGENDDLQCGVISRPLMLTLQARPELVADVETLWAHYRPSSDLQLGIHELRRARAEIARQTKPLYDEIRKHIIAIGVPASVRECLFELRAVVHATPQELRPLMRDLTLAFLDRLRRCKLVDLASVEVAYEGPRFAQTG